MKKFLIVTCLFASISFMNAQVFTGKGDTKFQVGANFQDGGTGITSTVDFGLGENMSFGFVATYLLNAKEIAGEKARFEDRADIKARFNANIGSVMGLDPKMDVYPGLDLGTRNFGAHLGFRYFFSSGFGLYTEAFAHQYGLGNEKGIEPYTKAAILANELGLGINAGHDLSLDNIKFFKDNIPNLLEVSIGHALISEALYLGLDNVVNMYLNKLK